MTWRFSRRTLLAGPAGALAQQARPQDPHRPKFHFLPPANWMNDPNGPIYWRGKYHLFYQHNPHAAYWGDMHWGHAVSTDMIHWRHLPIALAPTKGGYDKDGVFSGCAVDDGGVPSVLYTGTKPEVQCLATSEDGGYTWKKFAGNPVIPSPPPEFAVTGFRDPCVWREGDTWSMALGSGVLEKGGMVLLYSSPNLREWTYMHPLYESRWEGKSNPKNPVASGEMWECPSFFSLGGKHVLFVSTQATTPFYVGRYENQRFIPESEGRLDCGAYYAPITQTDEAGRRILWGWIQEKRSRDAQIKAGWSGVMSLPRVLSIRKEGRLGIDPAPQCRLLRGARQQFTNLIIPENRALRVPGVDGDALEILAEFDMGDAEEVGFRVLNDVPITYSAPAKQLSVGASAGEALGHFVLDRGEPLRIQVFVDCSVIEVFFNGRGCYTGRAYPALQEDLSVWLHARGGQAKLRALTVYEMKSISNDRLTS